MAGNHLKRCALIRWSFSILNDDTKCLVWWVNNRNTEAGKNETENHVFFKNGWKPSQKMRLDALIIFHIEWQHQVSSLVGKQSKYWSKYFLWFGILWGSWILEIRARAGGGNLLFYIFYSDGPIYNLQSKQNKIKSQLGEIGCGRAPPPEHPRVLPVY